MGTTQKAVTYWWLIVCVAFIYSDVTAFLEREQLTRRHIRSSSIRDYHRSRAQGTCNTLILSSKRLIGKQEIIDRFRRIGGMGHSAIYRANHDNGTVSMELLYLEELQSWVMGHLTNSTQIAMHLESRVRNPQEASGGIHVLRTSSLETGLQWEHHPDLFLQCVTGHTRNKRAVWLFVLGIVSLASTVTTTALRGVVIQKGCLFYPSVCEMKEEFGNLKPLAEQLRSTLKLQMNEVGWFNLFSQLSKTQDYYIELEYLLEKLINKTDILDHLKLSETQSDIPITNSSDWILDHSIAYVVGVFCSAFEFLGLYKLYLKQTISTVLSAAGFVIGIGLSVYDLYTQITEEKRVRDELLKQTTAIKLTIKETKQNLALIKSFKSKYIKQIVKPLQTILVYFQPDMFPAFRVYIKKLHNPVNIKYTYTRHMNTHLEHIIAYIKNNLITIQHEIKRREILRTVWTDIETSIAKSQPPLEMLIKIENLYKHNNLSSEFDSQFELLRFLAVNSTNNTGSCYWGYRIDLIRNGQLDETNYTSVPLCRSPQLADYEREISTKVNETMAPCRIFRQLRDNVFDSMYKLLKYIADYILPDKGCYWGYDLTYIRNTRLHSPVFETMKVDAATFIYTDVALEVLKEPEYKSLCKNYSICEERWQKFLYCSVYPKVAQNTDNCGGEEVSGCRNMASVYVKDGFCY